MEKALIQCIVDKDQHILTGNINPVLKLISELNTQKRYEPFRAVMITIHGYDEVVDELWEIKEVRAWYHKLINRVPYLLYYIENDAAQTEQTTMLSLNDSIYIHEAGKKPISEYENMEELPRYLIKVKVNMKSYRTMCAELRKHGRRINDVKRTEDLIKELDDRYGIE